MDCQSPTSHSLRFLVNIFAHQELWISIFQAIDEWWVSLLLMHELKHGDIGNSSFCDSKNPNLPFYFKVLRSWGSLEIDNQGRTTENHRRILVYGSNWL